jgi:hypothetical protein
MLLCYLLSYTKDGLRRPGISSPRALRHDVLRHGQFRQLRRQTAELHQQPCRHMPRKVAMERPHTRLITTHKISAADERRKERLTVICDEA